MTMCSEGCEEKALDEIFKSAEKQGITEEIKNCHDYDKNKPWHKAAKHSNAIALRWIIKKWKQMDWELSFNQPDQNGLTPLMLCCLYGYSTGSDEYAPKL